MTASKFFPLIAALVFFAPFQARAQGAATSVTADGVAAIVGGRVVDAKDQALADARRKALMEVCGVLVDAQTLVDNGALLSTALKHTTRGLIRRYAILSEGPEGDTYKVRIKAEVDPAQFEKELSEMASSDATVLVAVDESGCGAPGAGRVAEQGVIRQLTDAGIAVVDPAQAAKIRDRDRETLISAGDASAARRLSLRFLSNILVTGRMECRESQTVTQGLVFARTTASVRVVQADTGRLVFTAEIPDASGDLSDKELRGEKSAANDCANACATGLRTATRKLASRLVAGMKERLAGDKREIVVEGAGMKSAEDVQKLAALVRGHRWVASADAAGFDKESGMGSVKVLYEEKPRFLAAAFEGAPDFTLVEFDDTRILLRKK